MDTEKAWEEFQANDSSIKKSESVQQDIQQILDTVTQIKTDVDQLKAEGPQANGPADAEPSLSAPEEQQPSPDMMDGMPPVPEAEPQAPMGDLNAQPEDGAATPVPEAPVPDMEEPPMDIPPQIGVDTSGLGEGMFSGLGDEEESDQDILLDTAREVSDPAIKQQLLAMVYQLIEDQKAPPAPPIEEAAPMMEEGPAPEEILAAAMDANGDGMISEEEVDPLMRSAGSETVQCTESPADKIMSTVQNSDDEEKEDDDKEEDKKEESDEKKDDDDKSERPKKEEPGVNDELPEGEEDKDSLEELPEVTEVTVETEAPVDSPEEEDNSEIDKIIDTVLDDAKREIKEQIVSADHAPFFLSTSEMMKSRQTGGSHRSFRTEPVRKAIEWPESFEGVSMEDKCRLFAKSFSQMPEAMQDNVVTLMDTRLGSEVTSAIFKSEGVDLDEYYEPIMKSPQDHEGYTHGDTVSGNGVNTATDKGEGMTESCEESVLGNFMDNRAKGKLEKKYQAAGPDKSLRLATSSGGFSAAPEGMSDKDRKTHMNLVDKGKDPHYGFEDRYVQAYPQNIDGSGGGANLSQKDYDNRKSSTVQNSADDTESLEACKKSATPEGVGIHIPSVSEMMAFKKSGTSMYTAITREAAEPHGMVAMGPDNEIPSVKDMFAKRFGN